MGFTIVVDPTSPSLHLSDQSIRVFDNYLHTHRAFALHSDGSTCPTLSNSTSSSASCTAQFAESALTSNSMYACIHVCMHLCIHLESRSSGDRLFLTHLQNYHLTLHHITSHYITSSHDITSRHRRQQRYIIHYWRTDMYWHGVLHLVHGIILLRMHAFSIDHGFI